MPGTSPRRRTGRGHAVRLRAVEDLLCGIEPQTVEMKFVDPVRRIGDEELAHWYGIGSIEVDGIAPLVLVFVGEVSGRERPQVISGRSEVVVDNIQQHADPVRV